MELSCTVCTGLTPSATCMLCPVPFWCTLFLSGFFIRDNAVLHIWRLQHKRGYSSLLKCEAQSADHCELQICVEYIRQCVQHKSLMVSGKRSVTQNVRKLFKLDFYQLHWMQIIWNSQSILQAQSAAEDFTGNSAMQSWTYTTVNFTSGKLQSSKKVRTVTKDNGFLQQTDMGKDPKLFSLTVQLIN